MKINWSDKTKKQKMKLIIFSVFFILAFSGVGYAIWSIGLSDSTGAVIYSSSDNPLILTAGMDNIELNVSEQEQYVSERMEFTNTNGPLLMNANITELKTDNQFDSCFEWEQDCNTSYTINGYTPLVTGENITISEGNSYIDFGITCKQNSCEQKVNTTIILSEV